MTATERKGVNVEAVQAVPAIQKGLMTFSYEGIRLKESCWIEGKPYFTMLAIGEWLEYKFPQQAIVKIIERNPHINQFRTVVKLTTVEGTRNVTREVEVYDPIGLQLIINKSNQPKAIAFQVAVAHLVYDYVTGNLKPFKWNGDITSALSQIISIPAGRKRKLKVLELAKETGKSCSTIYRIAGNLNGENLKIREGRPRKTRSNKGSFTNCPEFKLVEEYLKDHPGAGGKAVKAALVVPVHVCTVRRWIRFIRSHKTH